MTPKRARKAGTRAARRTGLQIIDDAPWGTHLCQFYDDRQDLVDMLVPYFKAGLEDNEFCMWVTSEPLGAEEARAALGRVVPDLDKRLLNHQIEILDYYSWYTPDGSFDADRVLSGWTEKLESARARGFDGLRLSANTFWLEKKDWRSFREYEAAVDEIIGRNPILAICTYCLSRCGALEIMDVVSNHAFALIKAGGHWQIIQSAERKRMESSLRENERLLRRAQEMAHLGSWELDLADHRLTWSDEVYRIFGLRPQEFGATYEAFLQAVHPEDRQAVDEAYSGSLRDGRDAYEITHRVIRRDTGEVRWVHEKCEHVRDAAGRVVRSWGMVQDVTERQRAEERLRHAQKLESIGLLAGGIAHDFNNLLVGVIGNASLAEEMAPRGSPLREILKSITQAGEQAAHLTRQMLAYAGKGQFVLEPVDLSQVVRDTRELLQSLLPKKITLDFQLQPDLPRVECDVSQMQQVLMNLVLNGGEAIGDGPGAVSISTGELVVENDLIEGELGNWAIEPGLCAVLEVSDTGCGMDKAVQARVFDPFFTTKFQGRGLGLAAVAGIVRAQGGAIQVASAPGLGSSFRVLLPGSARCETGTREPALRADAMHGTGTVLVIDDEPIVRDLAKCALERSGYEVLTAGNGAEAIELARSEAARIDLVLLDVSMPEMGGAEILDRLRALRPDLKVIVSSGYSENEALRLFHDLPISGFIQKPYTVHELAAVVQAGMERKAR